MIQSADALAIFQINMDRTNSPIAAMEKIKAYNDLYQSQQVKVHLGLAREIGAIQNKELEQIEKACAEHAIISLDTTFETYYRELLQEVTVQIRGKKVRQCLRAESGTGVLRGILPPAPIGCGTSERFLLQV